MLKEKLQFKRSEVVRNGKTASKRIHAERVIEIDKNPQHCDQNKGG